MDPISLIVIALATGAAAGLKQTAETVVKDTYAGIKALLKRKFEGVSIDMLESDPTSKTRQEILKQDLAKAGAGNDKEVLQHAKQLIEAIQMHAPEVATAVGVNLEDVKAASLRLDEIVASGTGGAGVIVKRSEFTGDIDIKKVRAGTGDSSSNP